MAKKNQDLFSEVQEAIQQRDCCAGLKKLLRQYRAHPSVLVGDCIVKLGPVVGVESKLATGIDLEKLKAVKRSDQLKALSPALDFVVVDTMKQAVERLEVISEWDPDPRVDRQLIRWMTDLPYQSGVSRKFWSRVLKRFKTAIDTQAISMLPTVIQNHNSNVGFISGWMEERILRIVPKQLKLRDGYVLSKAETNQVKKILKLIPEKPLSQKEQLLASIFAAPEDDDCKRVYADYLAELNDPHGEFIHLQMAKLEAPLSKVDERRERALLNKHWRDFVGPLQKVIYRERLKFEKGFLSVCRVKDVGRLESLLDCPYWLTAKRIYGGEHSLQMLRSNSQLVNRCGQGAS